MNSPLIAHKTPTVNENNDFAGKWASVDNYESFPHVMYKIPLVIHILVIENNSSSVLQFYHIKARHRFVSNHSKCLGSVCSKKRI